MSKNKKIKKELKFSHNKSLKLKGVSMKSKHKKNKSKNETITDSVILNFKNEKISQDKIISKSNKNKRIKKVVKDFVLDSKSQRPTTFTNIKTANVFQKLNVNKLSSMLHMKEKEVVKKDKNEKISQDKVISKSKKKKRNKKVEEDFILESKKQKSTTFTNISKYKSLQNLNVNRLSSMLHDKEKKINKLDRNNEGSSDRKNTTPTTLRERMLAQLKASRFRFLNEQLYSNQSSESKKYFQEDPQAFYAYHEGYKHQVERWPINPVDIIIESIKKMPKEYVVADFGCGEAKIADSVPQKVHSFDLIAVNEKVTACDMSNTSLLTGRVNVVVFCLSLMGSNLKDYLLEANRVLEKNGILKVAEVESRFDKLDDFLKIMSQYGFVNTWKDLSNNLFYFMDFKKIKDVLKRDANKLPSITLKPCLYKKR